MPQYLPEVLADPYDGAPIRYKAEGDGYVVYSVGENGEDDGGWESKDNPWNEGDIVFSVKRSACGD